jgi:hypothetical protein
MNDPISENYSQQDVDTVGVITSALVAEFNSLRAEIATRSASQQLLVNLSLTTIALVLGVALSRPTSAAIILLIPIFTSCCAMLYFDHAAQITKIGAYISQVIHPRMRDIVNDDSVLAWEARYRSFQPRRYRTVFQFGAPILVLFVAGPLSVCAVSIAVIDAPLHWFAWTVGLILEVVAGYLWYQFAQGLRQA